MDLFEIINTVQQRDVEKFDAKCKAESEKRKLIKAQLENKGVSINELIRQLSDLPDEEKDLNLSQPEKTYANIKPGGGFPPPPNSGEGSTHS